MIHKLRIYPVLSALIAGTALQLQQPALLESPVYGAIGLVACVTASLIAIKSVANRLPRWLRVALTGLAVAALAFAAVGLRADAFVQQALDPALEGRDIEVTGVVAAMPQRNEGGLRFRLALLPSRCDAARGRPSALL